MTGIADVSVVIPTFERPGFLAEAVASTLAQTVPPREVIVVDNGRRETASGVLAGLGDRVRILRRPPIGVQAARNAGVAAARGRWVALLDDDDLHMPDMLSQCAEAMARDDVDVVATDHRKFDGGHSLERTNFDLAPADYWDGLPRPIRAEGWSRIGRFPVERLLRFIAFYPSQLVLRRDLYQKIGGYDPATRGMVAEDIDFLVRLLGHARLAVVWSPLVSYRLHDGNDSLGADRQTWGRWQVFNHLRGKPHEIDPVFRVALEERLPALRARSFDAAFRIARYAEMRALARAMAMDHWSPRRLAKLAIALAPPGLRDPAAAAWARRAETRG